jgi:hypothetical protein
MGQKVQKIGFNIKLSYFFISIGLMIYCAILGLIASRVARCSTTRYEGDVEVLV